MTLAYQVTSACWWPGIQNAVIVILEPDVYEYFPNSQAVNQALRTLISLVPEKRKAAAMATESIE